MMKKKAGDKMEMAMKGGKKVPAFLAKSGMADKTGRAVKRKTADVKGRAMKGK